jgi:hypothetical protein
LTEKKALLVVFAVIAVFAMLNHTSTPNKPTSTKTSTKTSWKIEDWKEREPAIVSEADKPCKRALNLENSSFSWII